MQSQQKRVKWSRGETAEAIEERTDTGVTQASVELMENCIPDIYGNISRRPALKVLPFRDNEDLKYTNYGFEYDKYLQVIPFYITENDYILIGIHYTNVTELFRVKNGEVVAFKTFTGAHPVTRAPVANNSGIYTYEYKAVSYAQQNNYMLIADAYNVYKIQLLSYETADDSFTASCEIWEFSGEWYAPNGTKTEQINNTNTPGLNISGNFEGYVYTDSSGNSTNYSQADTGLTGSAGLTLIQSRIPAGSIIQMPNIGCWFRVEGYYLTGGNVIFNDVLFDGEEVRDRTDPTPTQNGHICVAVENDFWSATFRHYNNRSLVSEFKGAIGAVYRIRSNTSQTGEKQNSAYRASSFSLKFGSWVDAQQESSKVMMYGSLLTPVVEANATDKIVTIEYGYVRLQPSEWQKQFDGSFPHPRKLLFLEQRLWAGGWAFSSTEQYSIVIGSQIARYNDLKNDYNQENEPVTLDILTQFKEKILHLVDYNGLKIMTESYEYAYDGKVVKQSGNGSLENCEPLVFESLCLYCDSTGHQIKAMQYEFQANIFNSSTVNTIAPHDLVWYPFCMAGYEDKINSTGKHLFIVNEESENNPRVAVCNFVPGNQANIWSRWIFPDIYKHNNEGTAPFIHSIVKTKDKPLFLLTFNNQNGLSSQGNEYVVPAVLDFEAQTDCESSVYTLGADNYFAPLHYNQPFKRIVLANADVAVYSDGVFQFMTKTGPQGQITADLTGLTNITVGLPINSKIVSHPIDVGGKTKSVMKRIGKVQMSVHSTPAGAITINGKTGYMNPRTDHICFYGVTGMKDEIKYTITNNNGAMFHLESLLMNIEYGTLDS